MISAISAVSTVFTTKVTTPILLASAIGAGAASAFSNDIIDQTIGIPSNVFFVALACGLLPLVKPSADGWAVKVYHVICNILFALGIAAITPIFVKHLAPDWLDDSPKVILGGVGAISFLGYTAVLKICQKIPFLEKFIPKSEDKKDE